MGRNHVRSERVSILSYFYSDRGHQIKDSKEHFADFISSSSFLQNLDIYTQVSGSGDKSEKLYSLLKVTPLG